MKTRKCPICGNIRICNRHHRFPVAVWGQSNNIIWLCLDCHAELHREINKKENDILKQYPEIYTGALDSAMKKGGRK